MTSHRVGTATTTATATTSSCSTSTTMTAAEELLRLVACRIGMMGEVGGGEEEELVNLICNELKKEYIREEWQLIALDSYQWQQLGAPIGLAVAIKGLATTTTTTAAAHSSSAMTAAAAAATTTTKKSLLSSSQPPTLTSTTSSEQLPSVLSTGGSLVATEIENATSITGKKRSTNQQRRVSSFATTASSQPPPPPKRTSILGQVTSFPNNNNNNNNNNIETFDTTTRTSSLPPDFETIEEQPLYQEEESSGKEETTTTFPNKNDTNTTNNKKTTNNKNNNRITKKPPVCPITTNLALNEFPTHHWNSRTFPMTQIFQQALLHAKSGPDLKAHNVFVMELFVLACALFLGAAVDIWGNFPMDTVADGPNPDDPNQPYVPRTMAIIFHFLSCTTVITLLLCTSGWIYALHATAAVSASKFHTFLVQIRYPMVQFLKLTELGILLFVATICVLFGGIIAATTTSTIVCQICFYLPAVLLFVGSRMVHTLTSYIGRIAFHGMLLMDQELTEEDLQLSATSTTSTGVAANADDLLIQHLQSRSVLSDDLALDLYHRSTLQPQEEEENGDLPSIFDFMFPTSQNHTTATTSTNNDNNVSPLNQEDEATLKATMMTDNQQQEQQSPATAEQPPNIR